MGSVISFSDRFEVEEGTVLFVGHHFFIRRCTSNISSVRDHCQSPFNNIVRYDTFILMMSKFH